MSEPKLLGYRRRDGSWGIRNYVLVISLVHCANEVASKIAAATGTAAIVHEHGCSETPALVERVTLGRTRAGLSPNVFGVLLVGLGCEQTDAQAMLDEIKQHTENASYLSIQDCGGPPKTVAIGIKTVREMKAAAEKQKREPMPFDKLIVAVQCGGSDWTTAIAGNVTIGEMTDRIIAAGGSVLMSEVLGFPGSEHIVAEHAVNYDVGMDILNMVRRLREEFSRKSGHTIEEINPTPENKTGGITTLVEKSMGNVKKMGTVPIQGLLNVGEKPPRPGLWIVINSSGGAGEPDSYTITSFAMSLAHTVVFSSGRGTPVGNATMPIVRLTGNSPRYQKLRSIFDFDAGGVMTGIPQGEMGQNLFDFLLKKLNGESTRTEENDNREYTIPFYDILG